VDYEVTEVPAATYAVRRETVDFTEVSRVISSFIEEVGRWAHPAGAVTGPPLSITSMSDGGRLNVATGWSVDGTKEPPGPIELASYPAVRAAVHVHVGPYAGLPAVYQELGAALTAAGHGLGAEPRELYESNPDEVGPEQYVTRIVWPLADE
jgi:effector-binding domain-containing protein